MRPSDDQVCVAEFVPEIAQASRTLEMTWPTDASASRRRHDALDERVAESVTSPATGTTRTL
jgi:hypothetical protein